MFLHLLMEELLGLNVPLLLDTLEINLTVVHVGLTEPPKLSMIDSVLLMEEKIPLYFLLLILPDVAVS
jgi:hypothetical protein